MNNFPSFLLLDGYKIFHKFAYNPEVTHVYSNFTNRFGKHSNIPDNSEVCFVGLQYFILEVLINRWNKTFFDLPKEEAIGEYSRVVNAYLGKPIPVDHYEDLHDLGYLPLHIKAVDEGTFVPYMVPSLSIVNTVSGFGWLTNAIETVLSAEIWGICTSATTASAYRKGLKPALDAGLPPELALFMCHDFSYRGMFGTQAAAMSGFGHLTSFAGSDTIPAGLFAEKYYGANIDKELVIASVDATEHSVMCSYGTEGEEASLEHLITEVTPKGIISIVSDTWDFWKLVTEYLPNLKDKIMSRDGTVVIRPDSGDPVDILCGTNSNIKYILTKDSLNDFLVDAEYYGNCVFNYDDKFYKLDSYNIVEFIRDYGEDSYSQVKNSIEEYISQGLITEYKENTSSPESKGLVECLWDTFGGTTTEQGYKLLDSHIGAIYGDSITLERQDQINKRLLAKGFVPSVVLGIGSYTYQYVTRDTHGSAVKATDVQKGKGNHTPIMKDPKTDHSKKSAKGLLMVVQGEKGLELVSDVTPEEESSKENLLTTVFLNGKLIKRTTLEEIRNNVTEYTNS